MLTNVKPDLQNRQGVIASRRKYYGTCYTLFAMQIFIYTGPTIMRVPRAYKDLNASLPVISLYNFVLLARSTQISTFASTKLSLL
jgi:hypothetical protein